LILSLAIHVNKFREKPEIGYPLFAQPTPQIDRLATNYKRHRERLLDTRQPMNICGTHIQKLPSAVSIWMETFTTFDVAKPLL
jgi:hypothetical protein